MPLNLYSSATTDSLLAAKLSDAPIDGSTYGRNNGAWAIITGGGLTISDLSNAATSTLNAGVPTAGQALTYDGTDLIWATIGGGAAWGAITGTLSTQTDLQAELDLKANLAAPSFTSGISVDATGITFSDSTVQTTAAVAGVNLGDVFSIGNVQEVAWSGTYPSPGQWTITFRPVNTYINQAMTLVVENGDGSISQNVKASVSSTANWTYTTTYDTIAGDAYIFMVANGVKATIPINYS